MKIDSTKQKQIKDLLISMESYLDDDSTFNPYKSAIKFILNDLSNKEKNILLLWHLCGHNCSKMATELNISKPYILKEITAIKRKIKKSCI